MTARLTQATTLAILTSILCTPGVLMKKLQEKIGFLELRQLIKKIGVRGFRVLAQHALTWLLREKEFLIPKFGMPALAALKKRIAETGTAPHLPRQWLPAPPRLLKVMLPGYQQKRCMIILFIMPMISLEKIRN